jgi:STE24 endopeptidase
LNRRVVIGLLPDVQRTLDALYPPARQAVAAQLSSLSIQIFVGASLVELVALFGYFYSGAAAKVRAWSERRVANRWLSAAAFIALTYIGFSLVLLPLDWYAGFTVPHAYRLSGETPATWFHDWAVGGALSLGIAVLLSLGFVAAVRRFGQRWTLIAAACAAPIIVFGNAIFPAYVAPLFNTYAPLPPSPLTTRILDQAKRLGIDASAVYVYDMSRQTNEGDAYVAGLGPTARISVGDTLLKELKPDEVLYVLAHEMGHYKLHHIWWGSLYGWLGSIAAIAFIALSGGALIRTAGAQRVRSLDDPAALPLLAALLLCFALATEPAANAISRGIEHAADAFAAAHSDLGDAGVRAFARLGSEDLSVVHPAPFVVWYFYTHPPLDERIEYAAEHENSTGQ